MEYKPTRPEHFAAEIMRLQQNMGLLNTFLEYFMETQEVSKSDVKRSRMDEARRRTMMRRIFWIGGGVIGISALVALISWAIWKSNKEKPGVYYPQIGQEHIQLKDPLPKPYNSNPPSSGAHYPSPANWGVYDYEVNDRFFIHNLEHGGIWISYRPLSATSSVNVHVVEHLKAIVDEFGGSKIVMAPRAANDTDIAVVAWTRVLKFDLVGGDISDDQLNQIRQFYRALKNRGPEFVPDTMPGADPKSVQ